MDCMKKKTIVLVVEDEAIIRMGAVDMLEEGGFAVIEACDADNAIRILELRNDVNVVFTDINMPGTLDGLRLAHAIRGRWPPIHLILTSGRIAANEEDFPANGRFIRKPYRAEHVIATVRELLASTRPRDPVEARGKAA
jgi:two-component system, response regulator PdtaR